MDNSFSKPGQFYLLLSVPVSFSSLAVFICFDSQTSCLRKVPILVWDNWHWQMGFSSLPIHFSSSQSHCVPSLSHWKLLLQSISGLQVSSFLWSGLVNKCRTLAQVQVHVASSVMGQWPDSGSDRQGFKELIKMMKSKREDVCFCM